MKGTSNWGISIFLNKSKDLLGFADSDWAGDVNSRKSTTGFVVFYSGCLIAWKSKRQAIVSLSSMEGELYAIAALCQEIQAILNVLAELQVDIKIPIELCEDNMGCIKFLENNSSHGRCKHIDVKNLYVKDLVHFGKFSLTYCPSEKNLADLFTKALNPTKFWQFCNTLKLNVSQN